MGELNVKKLAGSSDKIEYIDQLVADIEALDKMLKTGMFEKSPIRIGAEQEFCLADESWNPSNKTPINPEYHIRVKFFRDQVVP